ncbi:MAG: septal ring lytic transglycosylase RlpA family protein [Patescibacteria group bacterium]|nr:septal ring lytic transglycosylase RlpA family protein [Patescibacteria group bacterium]
MRKASHFILISASLLFLAWGVKVAPAVAAETSGYKQFFLDQGFLGRDFDLDVDDLGLKISFSKSDIPQPGVLHVITEGVSSTTTASGYKRFGADVRIEWTTNAADLPKNFTLTLKDPACGALSWHECALEEVFQGKTKIIHPKQSIVGSAQVQVHMGATVRLVDIPKYMSEGYASWYAYKRCPCAASPDFPKGTLVRVTKLSEPIKSIIVKINDFGPERDLFPERAIDLDKVAFAALASTGAGVMYVRVEPLAADDPDALAYGHKTTTPAVVATNTPKSTPAVPKAQDEWAL